MDKRRTPNQLKPPGSNQKFTGSNSKFARPRSTPKLDANATFRSHNSTMVGSARNLNSTIAGPSRNLTTSRRNLDSTFLGACPPTKSSIDLTVSTDNELVYDLAYNDYLQALMKQQLVKNIIKEHKAKLNDQILIQTEYLIKLQNTFKDILGKIENLKGQSDVVELLQMLSHSVSEIEDMCSNYNTNKRLNELNKILTIQSNVVSTKNIKPIETQEEYDQLMLSLCNLKNVMQKILHADKNFAEVNELAKTIEGFNELNRNVQETVNKICESKKTAAALALTVSSDFFAMQGGYL